MYKTKRKKTFVAISISLWLFSALPIALADFSFISLLVHIITAKWFMITSYYFTLLFHFLWFTLMEFKTQKIVLVHRISALDPLIQYLWSPCCHITDFLHPNLHPNGAGFKTWRALVWSFWRGSWRDGSRLASHNGPCWAQHLLVPRGSSAHSRTAHILNDDDGPGSVRLFCVDSTSTHLPPGKQSLIQMGLRI